MANFDLYFPTLLKYEGGYVFNPKDPGGETNLGVTDKLDGKVDGLIDYNNDGKGDVKVKDLKPEQAKIIYKTKFWDPLQLDSIVSQSVAEILFDFSVNSGTGTASRAIQKLLNISQDGKITKELINTINKQDAKKLFEQIKLFRKQFYAKIILSNPKLKVFEKGWNNRIESFQFKN